MFKAKMAGVDNGYCSKSITKVAFDVKVVPVAFDVTLKFKSSAKFSF